MAPVLSTITVAGNSLFLQFDRDIDLSLLSDYYDGPAQLREKFFLQVAGRLRTLLSVSFSRDFPSRLTLTFSGAAARSDQDVLLDYADPPGNDGRGVVQDLLGNDLRTFLRRHADMFQSSGSVFLLAAGYRDLLLTDSATTGTGNGSANSIFVKQGLVDNLLFGLDGNDTIQAGGGQDKLIGGAGDDVMDGNTGSDIYLIERSDHHRRAEINDRGLAPLSPSTAAEFDELRFAATDLTGGSTLTVFAEDSGLEAVTIGIGRDVAADTRVLCR